MKSYQAFCKIILLISAIFFTNASIGLAQDKNAAGVAIKKDSIVMHAGTKLSKADEKAINEVLKKYDKKLYRVDKFQKGKLTRTVGELKIRSQLESEVAKAKITGSTDSTVTFVPGPWTMYAENRTFTQREDAKRLMQELKPILQKYSKP